MLAIVYSVYKYKLYPCFPTINWSHWESRKQGHILAYFCQYSSNTNLRTISIWWHIKYTILKKGLCRSTVGQINIIRLFVGVAKFYRYNKGKHSALHSSVFQLVCKSPARAGQYSKNTIIIIFSTLINIDIYLDI